MAFLEDPRFPDKVSIDAIAGPGTNTDVVVVESGNEYRNQNWEQPLHTYEVSQAAKLPDRYEPLKAFFLIVGGRASGFRFKDWTDYKVATGAGYFSPIDSTHFQLIKRYSFGSTYFDRIITKPVSGTVIAGTGTYTLDTATGIVTKTAGADPDSWSGEFDVPCRFDIDRMEGHIVDKNKTHGFIMSWSSIPIVEIRDFQ